MNQMFQVNAKLEIEGYTLMKMWLKKKQTEVALLTVSKVTGGAANKLSKIKVVRLLIA